MLLSLFLIVTILAKGIEILVYKMTLTFTKVCILWAINKVLSKYRKTKKNCICQGGILTIEDVHNILV